MLSDPESQALCGRIAYVTVLVDDDPAGAAGALLAGGELVIQTADTEAAGAGAGAGLSRRHAGIHHAGGPLRNVVGRREGLERKREGCVAGILAVGGTRPINGHHPDP